MTLSATKSLDNYARQADNLGMTKGSDTMTEAPVVFSMDLANAPTSERFCYEAAAVLGQTIGADDAAILSDRFGEFVDEVVTEWTDALESAGYAVRWDAGDVVVWDLREFSDDDREAFFDEMFA